jgi:acetylglutamate synthase
MDRPSLNTYHAMQNTPFKLIFFIKKKLAHLTKINQKLAHVKKEKYHGDI